MKQDEEAQRMERTEEARGVEWTSPTKMLGNKN